MSRWITFYYDVFREHVSDLKAHPDRETALKYFNQHCKNYFQLNIKFKANKLPASYGYPLRKYWGISASAFKKMFGISVDEALKLTKGTAKAQTPSEKGRELGEGFGKNFERGIEDGSKRGEEE